jgi:ADP-ribosylation factor related protein 1
LFWDVGGQKSLRKIWHKYFCECNGVVFIIDGSDESRFDEVRDVIDELYTRKVLDVAGLPKV